MEQDYRTECSSRNGQYCLVEFNATFSIGTSVGVAAIQREARECLSASNCSVACKDSLTSLNNTVGCCLYALNNTGYFNSAVFDERLWNECGISLPQSCDATHLKIGIIIFFMIMVQSLA